MPWQKGAVEDDVLLDGARGVFDAALEAVFPFFAGKLRISDYKRSE